MVVLGLPYRFRHTAAVRTVGRWIQFRQGLGDRVEEHRVEKRRVRQVESPDGGQVVFQRDADVVD
jgi:hypothetical protein